MLTSKLGISRTSELAHLWHFSMKRPAPRAEVGGNVHFSSRRVSLCVGPHITASGGPSLVPQSHHCHWGPLTLLLPRLTAHFGSTFHSLGLAEREQASNQTALKSHISPALMGAEGTPSGPRSLCLYRYGQTSSATEGLYVVPKMCPNPAGTVGFSQPCPAANSNQYYQQKGGVRCGGGKMLRAWLCRRQEG